MKDNFSVNFSKLRKDSGMSQKQLGEYLGISDRAVSNWENGISFPSTKNLMKISKLFKVSPDYFYHNANTGNNRENTKPDHMESLTELYRIGKGPSSSHTIGPERACIYFAEKNPDADRFWVELHGSLAKT